jgi:hypothetical protein
VCLEEKAGTNEKLTRQESDLVYDAIIIAILYEQPSILLRHVCVCVSVCVCVCVCVCVYGLSKHTFSLPFLPPLPISLSSSYIS